MKIGRGNWLFKEDLAPLLFLDEVQMFRRGQHQTTKTVTVVYRFFKEVSISYTELVLIILFVLVAKLKLSSSENGTTVANYFDRDPADAY